MFFLTVVVLGFAGCGAAGDSGAEASSELSRRQKDSLIADMPLPGAGAVDRALGALEASERRARAHDSIR